MCRVHVPKSQGGVGGLASVHKRQWDHLAREGTAVPTLAFLFLHKASPFQPQGLCSRWFLCLERSFPGFSQTLEDTQVSIHMSPPRGLSQASVPCPSISEHMSYFEVAVFIHLVVCHQLAPRQSSPAHGLL